MNEAAKSPLVPVLARRQRALGWLAGATAFLALCAILAQWQRYAAGESAFTPERLFPALESRADDVTTIQVETKEAAFNVALTADGKWILPDKGNYPADFNQVRRLVLGLASLELVEPRTARADWQDRLGLGLPKSGGTGKLVTLKDAKGNVLATLVAGLSVEGASTGERQAIYVRRPEEAQTFVARGTFEAVTDQAQWLDKSFIDFARDRIRTVSMKPLSGPSYTVTRATPQAENFSLVERLPRGRTLRSEAEPNGVGNALIGISFTDVVPQATIDFTKAARASFQTFDGMALNISVAEKDGEYWLAFDAVEIAADPVAEAASKDSKLKPNIPQEVAALNALAKGRAFKLPRFKGTLLVTPLEALLNLPGQGN